MIAVTLRLGVDMRAKEKLTKAQKSMTLRYFPEAPIELLTEEQWLLLWDIVEPQIKKRQRDWYGRNVAYAHRVRAQYSIIMTPQPKDVSAMIDFCRAQNIKRKAMSERLGIELPMEYYNPVIDGFNRAKVRLLEEHDEMWCKLRRMWRNIAEGRFLVKAKVDIKNRADDLSRVSYSEVCFD